MHGGNDSPLTRQAFKVLANDILATGGLALSMHCRQRMRERDVAIGDILNCIRRGHVSEDPYTDIRGSIRAVMTGKMAARVLQVALSIDVQRRLIVVTVI